MADPKLEDGFCMLALEHLVALAAADFPKLEKMILAYMISAQYGPAKLPGCDLEPSRFGQVTLWDACNFRRAIGNLVAFRAVTLNPDGTYSLVADWELWVRKDAGKSARIGDHERRFIAHVSARFGVKESSKDKKASQSIRTSHKRESQSIETPKPPPGQSIQTVHRGASESGWTGIDSDASSANPLEDGELRNGTLFDMRARINTEKRREEEREYNSRPHEDEFPFIPPAQGHEPVDDPETAALRSHVLRLTTTGECPAGRWDMAEHVAREYRSWKSQGYSVAVVKGAIHKALKKGGHLLTDALSFSNYAQAVLNGYASDRAALAAAPPAVKPSKINEPVYHVPMPRPKPPGKELPRP